MYASIWGVTGMWLMRYAPAQFAGEKTHSVAFMVALVAMQNVLSMPTGLYHAFVLEEKFGFNKMTLRTYFTDTVTQQALAVVLGGPALAAILAIIQRTGDRFFYYVWVFSVVVQLFMITVYPIFILPLFNKLTPLEDGALKEGVEALAKRLNFPLTNLFVIDGSKRSAHSNAYFFGLPWKKHIVIYDTLIEKSETEEIVAVLGHELGHWSLSHTIKLFALSQVRPRRRFKLPKRLLADSFQFHLFYILILFSAFINNKSLYRSFGFVQEQPIFIGFVLFNEILAPMDIILTFTMNIISRKYEFEAGTCLPGHCMQP